MSHDLSGAALQEFIDSAYDEWEAAVAAERRADPDADESELRDRAERKLLGQERLRWSE